MNGTLLIGILLVIGLVALIAYVVGVYTYWYDSPTTSTRLGRISTSS